MFIFQLSILPLVSLLDADDLKKQIPILSKDYTSTIICSILLFIESIIISFIYPSIHPSSSLSTTMDYFKQYSLVTILLSLLLIRILFNKFNKFSHSSRAILSIFKWIDNHIGLIFLIIEYMVIPYFYHPYIGLFLTSINRLFEFLIDLITFPFKSIF